MLSSARRQEILAHLRCHRTAGITDLCRVVGASTATIRRDLKDLDRRGLLVRVHGGAASVDAGPHSAHTARAAQHQVQKRRIGAAAAALVRDNTTVLVTEGTTTEAMAPFLAGRAGVTVLTNAVNVATALSGHVGITVVVLGRVLHPGKLFLNGFPGDVSGGKFCIDIAFISGYGLDPTAGLTAASAYDARTDRTLLRGADRLVLLADSSKIGRRGPVRIVSVQDVDVLITDTAASASRGRRSPDRRNRRAPGIGNSRLCHWCAWVIGPASTELPVSVSASW